MKKWRITLFDHRVANFVIDYDNGLAWMDDSLGYTFHYGSVEEAEHIFTSAFVKLLNGETDGIAWRKIEEVT
jgi:hypothetical protein